VTGGPAATPRTDPGGAGLSGLVRAWSTALHAAGCSPLAAAERERVLTDFARRLGAALVAEPFDPAAGYRVGVDLVAAGFVTPETLGRTITLMNRRLATDLRLDELGLAGPPAGAARLAGLVEALAAGFVAAVHDRALDAQEAVRAAALTAQARAEQALRDSEARFRHFATHDAVTGLPNRALFTQRLTELLATDSPDTRLGVCCLDLDGFAAVNDSLGYPAGDRLLVAVAHRLRALAAPANWLVAHLDTDQFAILIEGTAGSEDAVKVADRALTLLAEPFPLGEIELPVTASAGVVEEAVAGGEAVELLRKAQVALHWAKADGKARWRLYSPERSATDRARYRLSAAMPRALRRGEFTLAYQPLVDLTEGRLVGVEALARWRHREYGLLRAGQFIELAEHTGLIVPLGNQLLAQACYQAARWGRLTGRPPYVSVNLSASQLHQPGLAGLVAQVLDRSGLPPERLQLEITEHTIVDVDDVAATLGALVALGVRIAIDDFGIGYSNLARLAAMPLHALKLDATFARPSAAPGADAFLATVVSLGHTLGLTVTAEGIETADQAERMRAAGCDTGQGWHLGRPVPASRITALVAGAAAHRRRAPAVAP
jgi:diguanylate cyclase (GGDEF)-like protein